MQNIFRLTNKYIVLATPLILYSLLSSIYMVISASNGRVWNIIFALVLFFLMTGAFVAGWFKMIKVAILEPEREDANSLIKEFPIGVGEYFLSSLGALFMMLVFLIIMLIISYLAGVHFIGDTGISTEAFAKALQNTKELQSFVASLSYEQLSKLNLWNILILSTTTLTYFLAMLFLPALFFKNKNPFIAFFVSLKDLFSRKIFKTAGIFLLVFITNFFITILSTIFSSNTMIHFVITLINFYFITIVGVGIFYYYYNNFVQHLVGQNVDIEI